MGVVLPGGPVGEAVLDSGETVACAVALAEGEREGVAVCLDDVGAQRGGGDAGEPGAGAEFEGARRLELICAGGYLVGEGDGGGPEGEAVGELVFEFAQEAGLVGVGEDEAGVLDGPLLSGGGEAAFLEGEVAGGGVECVGWCCWCGHLSGLGFLVSFGKEVARSTSFWMHAWGHAGCTGLLAGASASYSDVEV